MGGDHNVCNSKTYCCHSDRIHINEISRHPSPFTCKDTTTNLTLQMKLDDGLCSEPDHDIAAVDAL